MRRDLRVLKSILPSWAITFLRRLRSLPRHARRLRLHTPRARREAALQELEVLPARPLISLVMPTYKTDLKYLREAVDSLLGQHYPEWELIVVDDASGDPGLTRALSAYAATHSRIKFKPLAENAGIAAATNAGLALCEGEFVGFLDHDDTLTPDALLRVAQALAADPELDVVYSDSDKLTIGGVRADPFLKPDWSPVYALGAMYIGHLLIVRTSVAEAAGGFDSAFDKIQDFEFMLRVSERTDRIHHIPQILYHWRAIPGSIAAGAEEKSGVPELQARAVSAHLERLGLPARSAPHPAIPHRAVLVPANGSAPQPKVSIVVVARGGAGLERLRRSLEQADYPDFETIVIEEGSRAEAHNAGAAQASGSYLCFLAPDAEIVDPGWLTQLVLHASLPDVAAVGPKLVRPDGKVEQAGIAIGLRDPAAPMLSGVDAEGDGYYGALPCSREVSGLSAECMLVARGDFEREGGFSELYAHEFEDLDLCRRLARSSRKCVYAATATVLTHRSEAARRTGSDIVDRALFVDTWYDELLAGDPYFNRGFARQRADYVPSGWLEPVHRVVGAVRAR